MRSWLGGGTATTEARLYSSDAQSSWMRRPGTIAGAVVRTHEGGEASNSSTTVTHVPHRAARLCRLDQALAPIKGAQVARGQVPGPSISISDLAKERSSS